MKKWKGKLEGHTCDECCAKLNGKLFIHVGEQSNSFGHATRQAMLCQGCVKRAYIKMKYGDYDEECR